MTVFGLVIMIFQGEDKMKMCIYYCITILANIVSVIIFYESINITAMSALPLALIALMIFQAVMLKNEKAESGFKTAYASNLTPDEENAMSSSGSTFLLAAIPLMIPFIIFFSSAVKALSIIVYIGSLLGGGIFYRLKNKDKIKNRIENENKELKEQEKKEQLGKWK